MKAWIFHGIAEELAADLHGRSGLDIREAFIGGSFVPAQKGGDAVGRTQRDKGRRIRAVAEAVLDSWFLTELPEKFIGDNAYDSGQLDKVNRP